MKLKRWILIWRNNTVLLVISILLMIWEFEAMILSLSLSIQNKRSSQYWRKDMRWKKNTSSMSLISKHWLKRLEVRIQSTSKKEYFKIKNTWKILKTSLYSLHTGYGVTISWRILEIQSKPEEIVSISVVFSIKYNIFYSVQKIWWKKRCLIRSSFQ